MRGETAAHDGSASNHSPRAVDSQGSPRRRGGLSARQCARSAHLAVDRVPHHQTVRGERVPGAPQFRRGTRPLRGDGAPAPRSPDRSGDRQGHRVPQRGNRAHPGAGGARAWIQSRRPQARALRRPGERAREAEMTQPRKIFVKTFGCQMNVYDSERMSELLVADGFVATDAAEDADVIVLNTCHIREKAAEKVYSD